MAFGAVEHQSRFYENMSAFAGGRYWRWSTLQHITRSALATSRIAARKCRGPREIGGTRELWRGGVEKKISRRRMRHDGRRVIRRRTRHKN